METENQQLKARIVELETELDSVKEQLKKYTDGELETRKVSELTYDERFNFMKELVAAAENYRKAIIKFSENPHRELADSALDMFDMTMMCFITQVVANPQLSQPSEDKKDFYKKNLKMLMSNFK